MTLSAYYCWPQMDEVHHDWVAGIPALQQIHGNSLSEWPSAHGRHANAMAANILHRHYGLDRHCPRDLPPQCSWLCAQPPALADLARELGVAASVKQLRTLIGAAKVSRLLSCLGEAQYLRALASTPLAVDGLPANLLADALERDDLPASLASIGIGLLQSRLPADDTFAQIRMPLAFAASSWQRRIQSLRVEDRALTHRIHEVTQS